MFFFCIKKRGCIQFCNVQSYPCSDYMPAKAKTQRKDDRCQGAHCPQIHSSKLRSPAFTSHFDHHRDNENNQTGVKSQTKMNYAFPNMRGWTKKNTMHNQDYKICANCKKHHSEMLQDCHRCTHAKIASLS